MIPLHELPRVVFVMGKGGVGRSTVAAALATALARRDERVLVFEWTLAEAIAPWFGFASAGLDPVKIAPRVSVANFRLDDALHAFFAGHLRMGLFYRHVVHGRAVRRLVDAAPGIAEMMFLGHVCWLTTLAEKEAGLRFDRVIVDTPAAGHGASILDIPATLAPMHASGLLGTEMEKVSQMMGDPCWTGAIAVSLPEELSVEETLELVPRATKSLGRPLLGLFVNRSTASLVRDETAPAWLRAVEETMPPAVLAELEGVRTRLAGRLRFEEQLRRDLAGATLHGISAFAEQLALGIDSSPSAVVKALASSIHADLAGGA